MRGRRLVRQGLNLVGVSVFMAETKSRPGTFVPGKKKMHVRGGANAGKPLDECGFTVLVCICKVQRLDASVSSCIT